MKIKEIIASLKEADIENAEGEAYLIVEHLFNVSYAMAKADKDREYASDELSSLIEKRKSHIPLQHILGEWYFMGEKFYVSPHCLIPRPDTEILVEKAIKSIKKGVRIADLCTGSGCIGISVLNNRPDINSLTLVDISEDAMNMARKNAILHSVADKCEFVLADVTEDILNGEYGAILSNPPYILEKDMDTLSDEVKKEPKIALDGGEDGMKFSREIVGRYSAYLTSGGKMLFEIGYDQGEKITKIARENGFSCEIYKDFSQNDRVALIFI